MTETRTHAGPSFPMSTVPFAMAADKAPAYWFANQLWIILLDGEATGGRFAMMEQHMPKDTAPIPHVHQFSDEWFYLMEGALEGKVGDQTVNVAQGDTLWIPRGTVHSFTVTSDFCRALNAYEPAGFEQVIKNLAQPAERRELPPAGPMPSERDLTLLFNNYWVSEADHGWSRGIKAAA